MDAVAKEVAEYEATRDRLPHDAEAQVIRLLMTRVITAGRALMDVQPFQERWQRCAKQYEELLVECLEAKCPHKDDHRIEAIIWHKQCMESVKDERDYSQSVFEGALGRFDAAKQEYLSLARGSARSAAKCCPGPASPQSQDNHILWPQTLVNAFASLGNGMWGKAKAA